VKINKMLKLKTFKVAAPPGSDVVVKRAGGV
jgi:hypothetical protein